MNVLHHRIGDLNGLDVIFYGFSVIGFRAGRDQIAHQAHALGLNVGEVGTGVYGLLGFRDCFRESPQLTEDLRPGDPISRIFGLQAHGVEACRFGFIQLTAGRQNPA